MANLFVVDLCSFFRKAVNCIYRKTLPSEFETLVNLRVEFINDLHPELDDRALEELQMGTRTYMQYHVSRNLYFGFLGIVGMDIVCSSGMLVYTLPPILSADGRKIGHILNFFTRAPFRGKGYGRGLMQFVKTAAKEDGISRLFLNATNMGYPLYTKCGFVEPDNKAMQLDL